MTADSPTAAAQPGAGWGFPCLVIFILILALHASLVIFRVLPIADGQLINADAYLHLVRVSQLHETGAWFDVRIPGGNAPYGEILNWTRPFDILLLAGSWLLAPFMAFKDGIFWSGAFISPVLLALTTLALGWAAAPFLDRMGRLLVMVLMIMQPAVMIMSIPGRADHHTLLFLEFVISLGLILRVLLWPYRRDIAIAAGAAVAAGIWFSVEFLLVLVLAFAATGLSWVIRGGEAARKTFTFTIGFTLMILVALVIERPPAEYLLAQYDRLSIVHVFIGLLATGFWGLVHGLDIRGKAPAKPGVRLIFAGVGAAVAGAAMALLFPKFFMGPLAEMDPEFFRILNWNRGELAPLWPTDVQSLGLFLFFLGPALICVPFVLYRLVADRGTALWPGWLLMALAFGLFLPMGLQYSRFAPYGEILLTMMLAALVNWYLVGFRWKADRLAGKLARAVVAVFMVVGFPAMGLIIISAAAAPATVRTPGGETKSASAPCRLIDITPTLNDPLGWGAKRHIIITPINQGPEILYRTRHGVLASPNHRNAAGNIDNFRILTAIDDDDARRRMRLRGADAILICTGLLTGEPDFDKSTLFMRLLQGHTPPWLKQVKIPGYKGGFRLYEVVP